MEQGKAHVVAIKKLLTKEFSSLEELRKYFDEETLCKFMVYSTPDCSILSKLHSKRYLGMGSYGMGILVCIKEDCTSQFAVKITPFQKSGGLSETRSDTSPYGTLSIENPRRPENVEYLTLKLLNERILTKHPEFPHIIILMTSFVCNLNKHPVFREALKQIASTMQKPQRNPLFHADDYRITLLEFADFGSLDKMLLIPEQHLPEEFFENIFFQIVMILCFVQNILPNFRHNDMHPGNILLRKYTSSLEYIFDNKNYKIKNPVLAVLLHDFDFAEVKPEIINQKMNDFYGNDFTNSRYYDLHTFFNALHSVITFSSEKKPYQHFMNSVVPEFIRGFVVYMNPSTLETRSFSPKNELEMNALEEKYIYVEHWRQIINYHRFIVTESFLSELFKKHNFDPSLLYPANLLNATLFQKFKV